MSWFEEMRFLDAKDFNNWIRKREWSANFLALLAFIIYEFLYDIGSGSYPFFHWTVRWHVPGTPAERQLIGPSLQALVVAVRIAYGAYNAMLLTMRQAEESAEQTRIQREQLAVAREQLRLMREHPGGDVHLSIWGCKRGD